MSHYEIDADPKFEHHVTKSLRRRATLADGATTYSATERALDAVLNGKTTAQVEQEEAEAEAAAARSAERAERTDDRDAGRSKRRRRWGGGRARRGGGREVVGARAVGGTGAVSSGAVSRGGLRWPRLTITTERKVRPIVWQVSGMAIVIVIVWSIVVAIAPDRGFVGFGTGPDDVEPTHYVIGKWPEDFAWSMQRSGIRHPSRSWILRRDGRAIGLVSVSTEPSGPSPMFDQPRGEINGRPAVWSDTDSGDVSGSLLLTNGHVVTMFGHSMTTDESTSILAAADIATGELDGLRLPAKIVATEESEDLTGFASLKSGEFAEIGLGPTTVPNSPFLRFIHFAPVNAAKFVQVGCELNGSRAKAVKVGGRPGCLVEEVLHWEINDRAVGSLQRSNSDVDLIKIAESVKPVSDEEWAKLTKDLPGGDVDGSSKPTPNPPTTLGRR